MAKGHDRYIFHDDIDELEKSVYTLVVYVIPTISFIGIVCNILSVLTLFRYACKGTYYLLLTVLAIFDMTCLSTFFLTGVTAEIGCRDLFRKTNSAYSLFLDACNIIDNISGFNNFQMPIFITAERLMILFYPFSYKNILTKKRSIILIIFTFIWCSAWSIYRATESRDYVAFTPCSNGTTFDLQIKKPDLIKEHHLCAVNIVWFRNTHERGASRIATSILCFLIPIVVTVCGNIVIIWKLISLSRKRNIIHGKEFSLVRQTQGVILVCTSFVLFVGTILVIQSGILDEHYADCGIEKFKQKTIMKEIVNLLSVINFSGDPIIYIIFNPKLRPLFQQSIFSTSQAVYTAPYTFSYFVYSNWRRSARKGKSGSVPKESMDEGQGQIRKSMEKTVTNSPDNHRQKPTSRKASKKSQTETPLNSPDVKSANSEICLYEN